MQKIKEYTKELALFILGFIICCFFFYVRILLKRIPYDIPFIWSPYKFLFYFSLSTMFGILTYKKLYPTESKNFVLNWVKEHIFGNIKKIYNTALLTVYAVLFETNSYVKR